MLWGFQFVFCKTEFLPGWYQQKQSFSPTLCWTEALAQLWSPVLPASWWWGPRLGWELLRPGDLITLVSRGRPPTWLIPFLSNLSCWVQEVLPCGSFAKSTQTEELLQCLRQRCESGALYPLLLPWRRPVKAHEEAAPSPGQGRKVGSWGRACWPPSMALRVSDVLLGQVTQPLLPIHPLPWIRLGSEFFSFLLSLKKA